MLDTDIGPCADNNVCCHLNTAGARSVYGSVRMMMVVMMVVVVVDRAEGAIAAKLLPRLFSRVAVSCLFLQPSGAHGCCWDFGALHSCVCDHIFSAQGP